MRTSDKEYVYVHRLNNLTMIISGALVVTGGSDGIGRAYAHEVTNHKCQIFHLLLKIESIKGIVHPMKILS